MYDEWSPSPCKEWIQITCSARAGHAMVCRFPELDAAARRMVFFAAACVSALSMIGSSSGKPKDMVMMSTSHTSVAYSMACSYVSINMSSLKREVLCGISYLGDDVGVKFPILRDPSDKYFCMR